MAVKMAHAVKNDLGTARGGKIGDPSGTEVTYGKWYAKNKNGQTWTYYIQVLDPVLAEKAARMAEQIVDNPGIGYGQESDLRGTLYIEAKKHGNVTEIWATCDCSSMILAIFALLIPGFSPSGSTATMLKNFQQFPELFRVHRDEEHLFSDDCAQRGGVYLRVGHVAMILSNGPKADVSPLPEEEEPMPTKVICQIIMDGIKLWCNVRESPSKDSRKVGIARAKEIFDVFAIEDEWYAIDFHGRLAYVFYDLASEIREGNV